MNWRIISTLVVKDVTLYFRNRFFALVTILAVGAYAAIFFVMPSSVDEVLEIGLYAPTIPPVFVEQLQEEGVIVRAMESEGAMKEAMAEGEYNVGVVLSGDLMEKLRSGQKDRIQIYFTSDFPEELQDAYAILFQELAFLMSGQPLDIEASEEILGMDMTGKQIPPRNRMLPLFAVFILMVETMGLASLITAEIEGRTLQALLITPMQVEGLFLGKTITGVGLAFVQVALLMAVTLGLSQQPLLILIALLLGSLLVTGIGFMMASVAKDMMSVMAWGVLAIVTLSIPTFNVLLPGTVSDWVKIIPSYYLVDTVHRVVNFGAGWSDVGSNLLILLAFAAAILCLGVIVLRRRFR